MTSPVSPARSWWRLSLPPGRAAWLLASGAGMLLCWAWLWTQRGYWNPLVFTGLWTAATIFVRTLTGQPPLPWRRHLALMVLSAPLWWWFELVNQFVRNWQYHGAERYTAFEYQVFATLAFSTVVPALDAAWTAALLRLERRDHRTRAFSGALLSHRGAMLEVAAGIVGQIAVFLWPGYAYSLTWTAPFLVFDGLAALAGGVNLLALMRAGQWRLPAAVALGGLGCGFCWELWNFYAWPKWTYDVPFVHYLQVFEMPLLGYLGYVPFAWSVHQVVALAQRLVRRR